jgi:Family of unknown function (DUF6519)
MKGDFSRNTFDPFKHYSRVLLQQGRVTLDADANEQSAILLHHLRVLTRDLLGPNARPANAFQLDFNAPNKQLEIGPGHCYVNGTLCENDKACTYAQQWDYTPPADDPLLKALSGNTARGSFGLYLDVWERHITWIEDDHIREKALNGPDTCTRAKVVWQVKAAAIDGDSCAEVLNGLARVLPRLDAQIDPSLQPKDPCTLAPDARYRGPENQLYRVEVHRGGDASKATFKWSRDNGSVATHWLNTEGSDLVVSSTRGFSAGNWVELSDDIAELQGSPGTLVKVVKVTGDRLTVDITTGTIAWSATSVNPKVRRWDEIDNDDDDIQFADDNAIKVIESTPTLSKWLTLEDGLQVRFIAASPNGAPVTYATGDYWLIPARVATGRIEWPPGADDANGPWTDSSRPPFGLHQYAALGVISFVPGAAPQVEMCPCTINRAVTCPSELSTNPATGVVAPNPAAPAPAAPRVIAKRAGRSTPENNG